jgi:hypothetical protein
MTIAEMIAWLEVEKTITLLDCRRVRFQEAIDKLREMEHEKTYMKGGSRMV